MTHEAVEAGGFGAEIIACVAERAPGVKLARCGMPRVPLPFSPPLEEATKVTPARIVAAAERLLAR